VLSKKNTNKLLEPTSIQTFDGNYKVTLSLVKVLLPSLYIYIVVSTPCYNIIDAGTTP
jgi:hypothetical protein